MRQAAEADLVTFRNRSRSNSNRRNETVFSEPTPISAVVGWRRDDHQLGKDRLDSERLQSGAEIPQVPLLISEEVRRRILAMERNPLSDPNSSSTG